MTETERSVDGLPWASAEILVKQAWNLDDLLSVEKGDT